MLILIHRNILYIKFIKYFFVALHPEMKQILNSFHIDVWYFILWMGPLDPPGILDYSKGLHISFYQKYFNDSSQNSLNISFPIFLMMTLSDIRFINI